MLSDRTPARVGRRSLERPLSGAYDGLVSDRMKLAVEWAIILLIAAAVYFVPGGSDAAAAAGAAISAVFGAALVFAGVRLYREHNLRLYGLGEHRRALLYGAVAVAVVTVAAQPRMWQTGFGELCWFALMGLVGYTFFDLVRHARRY
jgi:hypothetical protein